MALDKISKIVLVPGHGLPGDPGAVNGVHREATQNRFIMREIAALLRNANKSVDTMPEDFGSNGKNGSEVLQAHINWFNANYPNPYNNNSNNNVLGIKLHRDSANISGNEASRRMGMYYYNGSAFSQNTAQVMVNVMKREGASQNSWVRPHTAPGFPLGWLQLTNGFTLLIDHGFMQGDNSDDHLRWLAQRSAMAIYEVWTGNKLILPGSLPQSSTTSQPENTNNTNSSSIIIPGAIIIPSSPTPNLTNTQNTQPSVELTPTDAQLSLSQNPISIPTIINQSINNMSQLTATSFTPYLLHAANQPINVTVMQDDNLKVPVVAYYDSKDVFARLALNKLDIIGSSGKSQKLADKIGIKEFQLDNQGMLNTYYQFGRILTKNDLPEIGVYTGTVIFTRKYTVTTNTDDTNPVLQVVPVVINVQPNPLSMDSKFLQPNGVNRYSVEEMIESLYSAIMIAPRYAAVDDDGKYTITYSLKDPSEKILRFKGVDNQPLPMGAVCHIVGLKNKVKRIIPLVQTDNDGKDFNNNMQITEDYTPCSYGYTGILPIGEYYYFAEWINKKGQKQQSKYLNFIVS